MLGDLIPLAVVVVIIDGAVVVWWLARRIDVAMLGAKQPWRFNLATLLGVMALAALNFGVFAAMFLRPRF